MSGRRGQLSQVLRNGGGPRPRSNGAHTGPLRKVVSVQQTGGTPLETLECGHTILAKRDLMGVTNAFRRRCWMCKKEAE